MGQDPTAIRQEIEATRDQLSDAAPGTADVKQAGRQAVGIAQQNPLGLAIGAAAIGFLAGMLIPATEIEDQRIGPVADQLKSQARHTSQDAIEHGKQVAQTTAQVAMEKAGDVGDSLQDVAHDAGEQAQEAAAEVKETAQNAARSSDG